MSRRKVPNLEFSQIYKSCHFLDQSVKIEHEIPKVDTTDIIVEENKEKSGFFSVDRNVVILTSFIIFLWLAVIVAIIFLKVAIDKCRSRGRKDISTSNIV